MNEFELIHIGSLLLGFSWEPFNVTFDHAVCNRDPLDPEKYSIVAFADDATQKKMMLIADAVEKYLLSNGT